jgi:SAM-dependent methyltransferase
MPQEVLAETYRLLRPGGLVFFTVPFVWPIHCIPYDEYRYTPFALQRILSDCGFKEIQLKATGGRNSVLAVMLGLWIRRKPLTSRVHIVEKWLLSRLMWPVIYGLYASDVPPDDFYESALIVGISGFARKPV